jgi:putative glycosyltransferase (TIGR04372 family)
MFLIKLFFYFISPIFFVIVLIISPFLNFRFFFLSAERIGELTYQIEKYHLLKQGNKNRKRYFDVFIFGNKVCNKTYLSIFKKNIFLINGVFIFPVYRTLKWLSNHVNFFKRFILGQEKKIDDLLNTKIVFNEKNRFTEIPDTFLSQGDSFLKKLNINHNDKIILLYVRDSKYLSDKFVGKDYSYHNFRDCNIDNFDLALEELISRGYYIFRVGDNLKNPIYFKNKKFIDYSKLYRSDLLDIYLSSRCSYIISCGGGFGSLSAITFRKPILYLNGVPTLPVVLDFYEKCIYSIKLHYDTKLKKYLNFREIIKNDLSNCLRSELFEKKNIILEENNNEDIKDIVIEFINKFENNVENTYEENALQDKVLDIFLEKFNLQNKKSYKLFKPKISKTFLKKYNFLLNEL